MEKHYYMPFIVAIPDLLLITGCLGCLFHAACNSTSSLLTRAFREVTSKKKETEKKEKQTMCITC